jgi:hypothetical protein
LPRVVAVPGGDRAAVRVRVARVRAVVRHAVAVVVEPVVDLRGVGTHPGVGVVAVPLCEREGVPVIVHADVRAGEGVLVTVPVDVREDQQAGRGTSGNGENDDSTKPPAPSPK